MENLKTLTSLESIETYLKSQDTTDENTIALLHKIVQCDVFIEHIDSIIKEKEIFFLRHAHSEHNNYLNKKQAQVSGDYSVLKDPSLSNEGLMQCERILKKLPSENYDLIFVSPLTRALQTCQNIIGEFNQHKSPIVSELIREKVADEHSHVGKATPFLKELFPSFNWEFIGRDNWWGGEKRAGSSSFTKEHHDHFLNRVMLFVVWALLRPERKILVISHSKVYKLMYGNNCSAKNGEIMKIKPNVIINFLKKGTRNWIN